jgi:hypothetical protein
VSLRVARRCMTKLVPVLSACRMSHFDVYNWNFDNLSFDISDFNKNAAPDSSIFYNRVNLTWVFVHIITDIFIPLIRILY